MSFKARFRSASWVAFLISSAIILIGGIEEVMYHTDKGIFIIYFGFIGLALSGLFMTIAYGELT